MDDFISITADGDQNHYAAGKTIKITVTEAEANACALRAIPEERSMNGAIVGSWFKQGGMTEAPVDPERVRRFMEIVQEVRETEKE